VGRAFLPALAFKKLPIGYPDPVELLWGFLLGIAMALLIALPLLGGSVLDFLPKLWRTWTGRK